jgi:hypothetical protein
MLKQNALAHTYRFNRAVSNDLRSSRRVNGPATLHWRLNDVIVSAVIATITTITTLFTNPACSITDSPKALM